MEELQKKIMDCFFGKVVRKDLAFLVKGNLPVPTYVLEYLLGQYCACDDEQMIEDGLEKVKDIISNNYVHRAAAEEVKGRIREAGQHRVIDKVTVKLNERSDEYQADFANLGLTGIPIGSEIVTKNPKLLSGTGVWSIVTVGYLTGDDVKRRWEIRTFKPIQIANVDVDDFIEQRQKFTTEEWLDFLIHTVGLNPENMNRREKFITLARLLPHVENNYNFMELGPKGTGKSHVFQELSPYGVLVSGGDVTSARLFSKMSGNTEILGLVGYWDVVAWDEYEQQRGRAVDATLIDIMQNYLANKSFNRGKATHEATASMSFVGNTKHTVSYMLSRSHLFESIPTSFIKGAFLDRIHLYNPGWEIKMLKKSSFSNGYGLITDYIAAVLHQMRNRDFTPLLKEYAVFDSSLSERDHNAIRKTFSGLVKLLYPNGILTDEEAYEIIDFAAEGRKRVKDQLYIIDETFRAEPAVFKYRNVKNGEEIFVETLECIENATEQAILTADNATAAGSESPEEDFTVPSAPLAADAEETQAPATATAPQRPRAELTAKQINIRLNQRGVSFKSLFGDYVRTAKRITIIDPFIRAPYQIDNLVEFIRMVREVSETPEELLIELHTQNEDERIPETIDCLDDLADDLRAYGIEFTYDFEADHDRQILLDNGWTINLGRGLDIYERFGRYSLAATSQELRRCRAFYVSYIKS